MEVVEVQSRINYECPVCASPFAGRFHGHLCRNMLHMRGLHVQVCHGADALKEKLVAVHGLCISPALAWKVK